VGIQTVALDLVVIATIHLMAKEPVLKAIGVHSVDSSSWFELIKLVAHIWWRMKEAL